MSIALTKKELASVAGYSYRRLHDIDMDLPREKKLFVRSGDDDKKYDLALFVQRWVAYNKETTDEESAELSVVKAQHERVKKEKTELEVARMKGEYVDMQEVHRAWSNIAAIVRGRFVNLARKLAPMLVMRESAEEIEEIIDRDVRDALNMIANTPLPGGDDYMPEAEEEETS
ncbi:MAG: hypothetical protein IKN04_08970 [Clostridia bacterium]|nr:hypothetical protein [Clostridia bacterium]